MNKLKLGMLNCHGIKNKFETPEFQKLVSSEDIFGVCETWLNDNSEQITVPGFNFYPLNRKNEMSRGGLGVFIKHNIKEYVKVMYEKSNENILLCKIKKQFLGYDQDLYIGITYIPPEYSTREKRLNIDRFELLTQVTSRLPSEKIILIGDFNARTSNSEDRLLKDKHDDDAMPTELFSHIKQKRVNQDSKHNSYGKSLLDYCAATQSYIANGRTLGDFQGRLTCYETRGSSTVDYVIVKDTLRKYVKKLKVLPPNIGSDHCPITTEISYQGNKNANSKHKLNTLKPKIIWNEKTMNIFFFHTKSPEFESRIKKVEETIKDPKNGIDNAAEEINDIFMFALGNKSPKTKPRHSKKKPNKWYDKTCAELSKNLKLNAYLLSKSPKDPYLRGQLIKSRKQYNKLVKMKKNEYHNQMIKKLENLEEKNPKEYWKIVQDLRKKKKEQQICNTEEFVTFFEELFTEKQELNDHENEIKSYVENTLKNAVSKQDFTLAEFFRALKILKNNKSAGPDRIPAEALKACPESLQKLILKLMNLIKNSIYYPEKWAEGITSLLHKDGDDEDPNNFRAITVTNTIAKVMAIMINERLITFIEENKTLKKEQIGFEKKARPADHLFVLKTLIDHYNSQGKKLYACFVDFQKAFDSVWRYGMYYKLIKSGIDTGTIKLFMDMYEKTTQTLKFGNKTSRKFRTQKGVKQGCILSPKLFNIFINDIPDMLDQSCHPAILGNTPISCLMYADDLILISETEQGLQNCLNKLHEYTEKWNLKVNLKKHKQ